MQQPIISAEHGRRLSISLMPLLAKTPVSFMPISAIAANNTDEITIHKFLPSITKNKLIDPAPQLYRISISALLSSDVTIQKLIMPMITAMDIM